MSLLIHPVTRRYLNSIVANPSHGLLLEGADGMGKGELSNYLAARLLDVRAENTQNHPYVQVIDSEGSISIDDIRKLTNFCKLKVSGTRAVRRVIIVENAQNMTHEAQNAFLKLLEEPPADTVIILTADNAQHMLPTILSRVVTVRVAKPTQSELTMHFLGLGHRDQEIAKAHALSGGLPGLMSDLLDDKKESPLVDYIDKAKQLLSTGSFERLVKVDELLKEKRDLPLLLEALDKVVRALLNNAVETGKKSHITKWHKVSKDIADKQRSLQSNPNTKLLLTDLVLNL